MNLFDCNTWIVLTERIKYNFDSWQCRHKMYFMLNFQGC